MANRIIINRAKSGLGRAPLGTDYISGLVLYALTADIPAGFDTPIKTLGSIADAEALGIFGDYRDETAATAVDTITAIGAPGDSISVNVQEPKKLVNLCTYVQQASDIDVTTLAASIKNAINFNTRTHGYTAISLVGAITVTARPGLGVFLNSGTPMSNIVVGSITATITQFSGGVASLQAQWHYHINRYFLQSPNTTLHVGIFDKTAIVFAGYGFPEVATMQTFADGKIRQLAIYMDGMDYAIADIKAAVQACQAQVAAQIAVYRPLNVVIAPNIAAIADISTLDDRSLDDSEHVSCVVGQDGGALGAALFASYAKSVSQLGDILGLISLAQVSDDIAWLGGGYNLAFDGVENAVPAFSNGVLLSAVSSGNVNQVDVFRYLYGKTYQDTPGTGVNDSHTCTAYTSDFAYIENCRTFDKATRNLYSSYAPELAAPLRVNADGTLTADTVASLEGVGDEALSGMISNNPNTGRPELSAESVIINPAQNVVATNVLAVSIKLVPIGVGRTIVLNLAYAVSL